jgi:hypothetical protein
MAHLAVSAAALVAMLVAARPALACDCASLDLARRVASAEVVLLARVSSFQPLESVTVTPVEVFKGAASKVMTIRTGRSDCDYFLPPVSPRVGEEYLLYLSRSQGELTANRCLAPGPAAEKASELRELRLKRGR